MGAFAGSAALFCNRKIKQVSVVTLTINNKCNLKCPHCYLQYDGADAHLRPETLAAIWASPATTLSIVGMEPLASHASAAQLGDLALGAKEHGMAIGFITNGLNAHLLDSNAAKLMDWVDVSIDGTASTYSSFRGASFSKLQKGIDTLVAKGVREINILQTVNRANISMMREMTEIGRDLGAAKTVLSPFCQTNHQGAQDDLGVTAGAFLEACRKTATALEKCWLVLDFDWLPKDMDRVAFGRELSDLFDGRVILFEDDPIAYGMIRVTYEGLLLTPRQAMHTKDYHLTRYYTDNTTLQEFRDAIVDGKSQLLVQMVA